MQNLLTTVEEVSVCLIEQDAQNSGSNLRKYVLDTYSTIFLAGLYCARKRQCHERDLASLHCFFQEFTGGPSLRLFRNQHTFYFIVTCNVQCDLHFMLTSGFPQINDQNGCLTILYGDFTTYLRI